MSTAHTSVPEVLDALKDVTYPAGKDRLVSAAREAGAPDGVVDALRGMPDEQYTGRAEVEGPLRAALEAHSGHGSARRMRQAPHGGRPGVAQHLWEEPKTPIHEEFDR
ncbi:DUF2795 domain-containing protein [Streptomyces sp. SID2955]|nr:DUF2795 domain-containing protein [Streptomyces sp. SID2955]